MRRGRPLFPLPSAKMRRVFAIFRHEVTRTTDWHTLRTRCRSSYPRCQVHSTTAKGGMSTAGSMGPIVERTQPAGRY